MEKKTKQSKRTELEEKLQELKGGWQRTQADFENFRKRTEEQKKELIEYANKDLLLQILPILDNLELAVKHLPKELEEDKWAMGVTYIAKQIHDVLSQLGVETISTEGEFNPSFHEAISTEKSEKEENQIIGTIQNGYLYKGKLLRPAKVKVSSGKEE